MDAECLSKYLFNFYKVFLQFVLLFDVILLMKLTKNDKHAVHVYLGKIDDIFTYPVLKLCTYKNS